jgi:5-formyltetrahydrofolate cyclo-ligase
MTEPAAAKSAKAALREVAFGRRDLLDAAARAAASARIADRAMAIIADQRPGVVAAYLPIRSECDPRDIIARVHAASVEIVLPRVADSQTLEFRRYRPGDPLVAGALGTQSPLPDQAILDPDLVILPLVGFDRTGMRLGHGRGYYDRAIAALAARGVRPTLVGIGFAAQEVEAIPAEPHDARLDWIVTENEARDLRRKK